MKTYNEWKKLFSNQKLNEFNLDYSGVVWLKLKSIVRRNILDAFIANEDIILKNRKLEDSFKELYELYLSKKISIDGINLFLKEYSLEESKYIEENFTKIESELYKLQEFSWGGDSTNSLDKQIVSFVKKTHSYDDILKTIETNISLNVKKYTLNTWYNNWTTILTEHLFRKHKNILSAVGKIKSVDFFIKDIPVDLKITYFPKGFIEQQRKSLGVKPELTLLKKMARDNSISFDKNDTKDIIKYQITEQLKNIHSPAVDKALVDLSLENSSIINNAMKNKNVLIKWLYEQQGELRFGSENRLFIIFIDSNDMSQAWELKRNFKLLKSEILKYLNDFDEKELLNNKIFFEFKNNNYETLSDIIFIKV